MTYILYLLYVNVHDHSIINIYAKPVYTLQEEDEESGPVEAIEQKHEVIQDPSLLIEVELVETIQTPNFRLRPIQVVSRSKSDPTHSNRAPLQDQNQILQIQSKVIKHKKSPSNHTSRVCCSFNSKCCIFIDIAVFIFFIGGVFLYSYWKISDDIADDESICFAQYGLFQKC